MTSAAQLALQGGLSLTAAEEVAVSAGRRLRPGPWAEIKSAVLRRDAHTCQICGQRGTRWTLQVHHRNPIRFDGSSELANLVTLCPECHHRLHAEHRVFRGAATFEGEEEWA